MYAMQWKKVRRGEQRQWSPTPHCPRRHSLQNFCFTAYHRRENVYSARHTFHSSLHLPCPQITVPSRDLTQTLGEPVKHPRQLYQRPVRSLVGPTPSNWRIQVGKFNNEVRRQTCAAAADASTRSSFSGWMNWRNIPTHPQNLFPSPGSLGRALAQCTALDWQKTRH